MRFNLKQRFFTLQFLGGIFVDLLLLVPFHSTPPTHLESTAKAVPAAPPAQSRLFSPATASKVSVKKTPVNANLGSSAQSTAHIRVQIARSSSQITIAASGDAVIRDRNHHGIARLQANQFYSVLGDITTSGGLRIGATALSDELWIDPGAGDVLVDGHWYEGQLQIVNTGSELLAINQLAIERYLYSVVSSEMYAAWQTQALKAQAVAARSYAMKFVEDPVSDWFDIGSDEAFQAYKGLESVTNLTIQAVEETRGQVLVRNNRILLAEYAASDAITRSAHRGQGMSQDGAQARAESGWSYLEILGHYYPDASVALLPEEFAQLK